MKLLFHKMLVIIPIFALFVSLNSIIAHTADQVVISEIHYHPIDNQPVEFIEIHNPTDRTINISQYSFTSGIIYSFPERTMMLPNEYILLVQNPNHSRWSGSTARVFGPYQNILSNSGEEIRLVTNLGETVEYLRYSDFTPWPRGADGYGPSLERISADLPAQNPYSWRASETVGGTPGRLNSVANQPARPVIVSWEAYPHRPTSQDDVQIQVLFDGIDERVERVELFYEAWSTSRAQTVRRRTMNASEQGSQLFHTTIPPHPSQYLIRFNWLVTFTGGTTLRLPHDAEPRPYESYFIYDHEIPSLFPLLWMFRGNSSLFSPRRELSGVAIQPLESQSPQLFDGARIRNSQIDGRGRKITFLKGEEFQGNRTLNVNPESPSHPNSGGPDTNHKEYIGYQIFEELGVTVPGCDWYRVIDNGQHGQRTVFQQPNEEFLEIKGYDPNGNIYKIAYNEPNPVPGHSVNYSKKTNEHESSQDLFDFLDAIYRRNTVEKEEAVRRYVHADKVINYSVASILLTNWDGYSNNMFLIHHPAPVDRWEVVPWDIDKIFGYTQGWPPISTSFAEMPMEFPLNGRSPIVSRSPGIITRPVLLIDEFYDLYVQRTSEALNGLFSLENVTRLIQEQENFLLEDLQLEAEYTGTYRQSRHDQIESASQTMLRYLHLRHEYLQPLMPTGVMNWDLF